MFILLKDRYGAIFIAKAIPFRIRNLRQFARVNSLFESLSLFKR